MNKQNVTPSSAANLAKNTLQELWTIKDETAANFRSVSAYFEHLRATQKLQTKSAKSATPNARKIKVIVKSKQTIEMH